VPTAKSHGDARGIGPDFKGLGQAIVSCTKGAKARLLENLPAEMLVTARLRLSRTAKYAESRAISPKLVTLIQFSESVLMS
jgi:hypothetical protein